MFRRFLLCSTAIFCAVVFAPAADPDPKATLILPTGPAGPCPVAQWKADWPGCEWGDGVKEGHFSIVERGGEKRFRVDYAVGGIGPEKGGVGWRFPFGRQEEAELRYTLRFSKDFDWVKGGKLPGLCGGPENVSGGKRADGHNGFSARLMWRADGRGEAYVYHLGQRDNYGDSFALPGKFRFPTDTDVQVRLRVKMNDPGKKNGTLQVWIAPHGPESAELLVDRADLEWRATDSFGIDGLYFDTFHGGGDSSWAPTRPCSAEFSRISILKMGADGK